MSWLEHADLAQALIIALIGIIAWVIRQAIASQKEVNREVVIEIKGLHSRVTRIESSHSELKGAHAAIHNDCNK